MCWICICFWSSVEISVILFTFCSLFFITLFLQYYNAICRPSLRPHCGEAPGRDSTRPPHLLKWPPHLRKWPPHLLKWPTHLIKWPLHLIKWPPHLRLLFFIDNYTGWRRQAGWHDLYHCILCVQWTWRACACWTCPTTRCPHRPTTCGTACPSWPSCPWPTTPSSPPSGTRASLAWTGSIVLTFPAWPSPALRYKEAENALCVGFVGDFLSPVFPPFFSYLLKLCIKILCVFVLTGVAKHFYKAICC